MNEKKKTEEENKVEEDILDEEEIEESIEESTEERIESLLSTIARLQADFTNYKNRAEKSRVDTICRANEDLILKFLPILDIFEKAFEDKDLEEPEVQGFYMIYQKFSDILEKEGLEEVESDGENFDHNIHHALLAEESDKYDSNQIIETLQKGYKLGDKLIRPAMVKVSK